MKKTTVIFIILYLMIFSLIGWWVYSKYFRSATSDTSIQTVNFSKDNTIFYTMNNNLYLLNANNINKSSSDVSTFRLQSTGQVQTINFDQKKKFFVYDNITPEKSTEIWKVNLADNHSEKIFAGQVPGFENYTNFRNPQMSSAGQYMAFIATSTGIDDIFIWDIEKNSIRNLTGQSLKNKISAISWQPNKTTIYFSLDIDTGSTIQSIDLNKKVQTIGSSVSKIIEIRALIDRVILALEDSNQNINLGYFLYTKPNTIVPITDLTAPKSLQSFDISGSGKKIVYQVNNKNTAADDLYLVGIDGSNLLQLSTDGRSQNGIFSPDNNKIAYLVKDSGIYTMNLTKDNQQKILNEDGSINKLILWR